mgnify:FL=1|jgi:hypothetical protein
MIDILIFLFLIPFNVFMWTIKYVGSFLFWIALVVWVYQSRSVILDWISDRWFDVLYRFRNRKGSTNKSVDDIDDYIV